jgi:hypothetical protein
LKGIGIYRVDLAMYHADNDRTSIKKHLEDPIAMRPRPSESTKWCEQTVSFDLIFPVNVGASLYGLTTLSGVVQCWVTAIAAVLT